MTSPKFSPAQAIKSSEITDWHIETDVAIVGFGGAGGCAAIEAAEAGAKVVVFEVAAADIQGRKPVVFANKDSNGLSLVYECDETNNSDSYADWPC